MSESGYDGSEMQCSYCGKWIYVDSPRCPKCGNYTDGLGPYNRPLKEGRPIPRFFVIAGWVALVAFAGPLLFALVQLLLYWLRGR